MRCIFCMLERPPSREHIFPLAIGGTITTDRVCNACNSDLGRRVDAALSDFLPVRLRRAELKLAGNAAEPPSHLEILLGTHRLAGSETKRIRATANKTTGKLDLRHLYHAADVVLPDGTKARQIVVDERDKDQIPKIIQRERKRHGLPPLSEEAMVIEISKGVVQTIENPQVHVSLTANFAFVRHALIKIAYELAFRWLGESYLEDPKAAELREAICNKDPASTDKVEGFVGELTSCGDIFRMWTPDKAHHLAFATVLPNSVIVAVRVFDLYAVVIPVSQNPRHYLRASADGSELRFLAIDACNRRTIETTFFQEQLRIANAMRTYQRMPPFPDPLSETGISLKAATS